MTTRIQLRRGTREFWRSENPILRPGEPGLETDTIRIKYGDGKTPWDALPYSNLGAFPGGGGGTGGPGGEDEIPDLVNFYENGKV